jgi:hypothetical protein
MIDGLWEKANQVSEVSYKLEGITSVAKLLGEAMSDDVNSGVAWTIAEMIEIYAEKLERLAEDIMALQRIESDKPKGKKK